MARSEKNSGRNNKAQRVQQQQATGNGHNNSNMVKDPAEWTTGDEPMTGAQQSYLKTLSDEAGEPFDDALTKAEASQKIDELQQQTGRGAGNGKNG